MAPALRRFKPDLLIVASGLDASVYDPLARQMMTSDGYRDLTKIMMDVASEVGGKLVVSHEGGYSPVYVAFCGLAVVETLAGVRDDPRPVPATWPRAWARRSCSRTRTRRSGSPRRSSSKVPAP